MATNPSPRRGLPSAGNRKGKLATRVTRARGIAALPSRFRPASPASKRMSAPGKRIATRQPVQKAQSARAGIRSKGAARLGAGSG